MISAAPAYADILIVKSDVPGIEKKSVLADDAILDIPENKSVKVIMRPSNVSKVLEGPYKGTVENYLSRELMDIISKEQVQSDPGGVATSPPPSMNNLVPVAPE